MSKKLKFVEMKPDEWSVIKPDYITVLMVGLEISKEEAIRLLELTGRKKNGESAHV